MKILGIIPARFASTRFPGKPLALIDGVPMIKRVYDQSKKCKSLLDVYVATDDQRIYDVVYGFSGKVIMTSVTHQSGTERCAEVLEKLDESYDYVVNIQGDEPYIQPKQIEDVIEVLGGENVQIASLVKLIENENDLLNSNVVKAVFDANNQALYFSRAAIPFNRNNSKENWLQLNSYYKHIGMYAYKAEVLAEIVKLPLGKLEKSEALEQLRWLENGYHIKLGITAIDSIGIDNPEDIR